jgi:hypothetical protein
MANTQILQVFQRDERDFAGSGRIGASRSGTVILGRVRELAIRAGVVHRGGKLLRQNLGELINRDIKTRSQLLDGIAAQHLLQLLGRDGKVLAVSDPGSDLVAKACLLQPGDDRREPALAGIAEHFAQHHRNYASSWPSAPLNAGEFSNESRIPITRFLRSMRRD